MTEPDREIRLVRADSHEWRDVAQALQRAFAPAVREAFGERDFGPIPPDEDVWASFRAPGAVVHHIFRGQERVGGAVVKIDEQSGHNTLELFFISPGHQGCGRAVRMARRGSAVSAHEGMGNRDPLF